jgi:ABC-type phosphate/phosphonate transport system substrate-binding protein
MATTELTRVGTVVYDPRVTVIWEIISDFFRDEGHPFECVYYKDYTLQVDDLVNGEIDIAWNSPLAWLDTWLKTNGTCLNGSMRDTDQDRKTYFLARKESGFSALADLQGKVIGFGPHNSPHARMIPINHLQKQGLKWGEDYEERVFNRPGNPKGDVSDLVAGEINALKALAAGEIDATVVFDLYWDVWQKDGTVDASQLVCLDETVLFDHCIFNGRPDFPQERFDAFLEVLHRMDYSNPAHRTMMDMEGLKAWAPGRISGFKEMQDANTYLKVLPQE